MTVARIRLDVLLVVRGFVRSQAHARAAILAGEVYVDHRRVDKAGTEVSGEALIEVRSRRPAFASRGGVKLEHALRTFAIDVTGLVAMDVGASTGGFTDCMLQHGAHKVFAIDVGRGQLSWQLRNDPRVVGLERQDVRAVTIEDLGQQVDIATVDVSFISLITVLPAVIGLVRPNRPIVALLKPQFETSPDVAKGGVVREPSDHRRILNHSLDRIVDFGLSAKNLTASPLVGPEGNLEFFLHLETGLGKTVLDVDRVVAAAHALLAGAKRVGVAGKHG